MLGLRIGVRTSRKNNFSAAKNEKEIYFLVFITRQNGLHT